MDYLERAPKSASPEAVPDIPTGKPDLPEEDGHTTQKITVEIKQKDLINQLNYFNFQNKIVLLHFRHKKYDRTLSIPALPQPCTGKYLVCLWQENNPIAKIKNCPTGRALSSTPVNSLVVTHYLNCKICNPCNRLLIKTLKV